MKILKSFSIYTLVGFFGAGVGFLVMPVLTHYLSPEDYGVLSLFNTYVSLLMPFIGFVAFGLFSVEYFKGENSSSTIASIFSSLSFIPIVPFILILSLSIIFRQPFGKLIDIPPKLVFLIPTIALLTIFVQQFFNYLTIIRNATFYAIGNVGKTTLEVGLSLVLIIVFGMNWQGRIWAWFIALSLMLIVVGIYYFRRGLITSNIKISFIASGLSFGTPLILHNVGKIIVNQSDRVFISNMVSVEELGIYNTGYVIGSVLLILSGAFINTYTPYLYERLSAITLKKKVEIIRLSYVFLGGMFLLLIILTFTAPILYKYLIGPRFVSGVHYVFWVGLGYFFWGGYLIFAGYIYYLKRTKILSFLSLINITLNLGLNYVMINKYGTIGAAYATAISFFVILLCIVFISNRLYPMPWLNVKLILNGTNE